MSAAPFYAYVWNKEAKRLEINEAEAETYKLIVSMYVHQGMSTKDIAIQPKREGIKCNRVHFIQASIWYMLKNSAHYGHMVANTKVYEEGSAGTGINRTKQLKPADSHILFPWPAIITKPEWDRVQERMRINKWKNARVDATTESFWLRDIAVCGHCGAKMRLIKAPYRKGRHLRYHACTWTGAARKTLEASGRQKCDLPYVDADHPESLVWGRTMMLLKHPYHRSRSIEQAADIATRHEVQVKAISAEIKTLEAEEKKLQVARGRFLELCADGQFDKALLAEKLAENERQALDVQGRIAEAGQHRAGPGLRPGGGSFH